MTTLLNAARQALEALEESAELVEGEYTEAVRWYGRYPSRKLKLEGIKAFADAHQKAMKDLRTAIADAEAEGTNTIGTLPGYQLVPVEPTNEMLEMGSIATDYEYSQNRIKPVWQQMLMAAERDPYAQPAKPLTRQQLKAVISAVPNPDDDNIGAGLEWLDSRGLPGAVRNPSGFHN